MIDLRLYVLLKDIETKWILQKQKQCHKSDILDDAFTHHI